MKIRGIQEIVFICLGIILLEACSRTETEAEKGLTGQPVVGSIETVNGDSVWVCRFADLKDTVALPLSTFTEELQIVKLDGREEAIVPVERSLVSENYILVYGQAQTPFKLFDKSGNYICNVGSFGQGPGEYQLVCDAQIDEADGRIYLLSWTSTALLAYDLNGHFVQSIPLPAMVAKGKFMVDSRNSVLSVFSIPYGKVPYIAWRQDLKGELLDSVPVRHLAAKPDYSNDVFTNKLNESFDVFLFTFFELRPDTLYHYGKGNLSPRFTTDFGTKEMPIHYYGELPRYFVGYVAEQKQLGEETYATDAPAYYIMDKQTLKGAYYKVENDFLGDMPVWLYSNGGYYTLNMEPAELKEALKKHLEVKRNLSSGERERLQKLMESINENDNNYILYAKLKQK